VPAETKQAGLAILAVRCRHGSTLAQPEKASVARKTRKHGPLQVAPVLFVYVGAC
jgi:hypothetical protein